jgi:hypothetical protein
MPSVPSMPSFSMFGSAADDEETAAAEVEAEAAAEAAAAAKPVENQSTWAIRLRYTQDSTSGHEKLFANASEAQAWVRTLYCAKEGPSESCECKTRVKYGVGTYWSVWHNVNGEIKCNNDVFEDPRPGHRKICICENQ